MKTHSSQTHGSRLQWKAIAALLTGLIVGMASAQDTVRVKWDPNPEPDIAGYTVYLGTTSGFYSSVKTISGATSAALSGLSASSTYYCAVQAFNTSGVTSELSSEISFSTSQAAVGSFSEWTRNSGLSGSAAAPNADPFGDGVANLVKYAFNMKGSASDTQALAPGTGLAGLPVFGLATSGAQAYFSAEFLRRKNSTLVYTPMISTDLMEFSTMTGTTTISSIDGEWERVVVRTSINPEVTPKLFARVEVMLP